MKKKKTQFNSWFGGYSLLLAAIGFGSAVHQRGETIHEIVSAHPVQQTQKAKEQQYLAWMDRL